MELHKVPSLLEHASRTYIVPRFTRLASSQIEEKAPGELVTIADREVEEFLSGELKKLAPGSRVVGEEACSVDPTLLRELRSARCWVIDPLDGTSNFVGGRQEFGILVGYMEGGRCVASWIYQSVSGHCFSSVDGAGARVNGKRLGTDKASQRGLRGIVKTRFLPTALREQVMGKAAAQISEILPGTNCTAFEYPDVANGAVDFVLYWRTLAWDHVPCVHFLEAAGGYGRRIDGSPYDPTDHREGLLVARNEATWHKVRSILFD